MLSTIDYKKVFETLASSHRGSIIVVGGDDHRRPSRMPLRIHGGATDIVFSKQTKAHIEKILYRTEAGTRIVDSAQFDGNKIGKDRIIFFTPVSLEDGFLNRLHEYALTRREEEIVLWVMRGLSNREIAEKLFICEQTVKDHLRDIFQRMRVRRRSELSTKFWMPAVDVGIPPTPPKRQPR